MRHFTFSSESVTEGHPDKICDQISDAVLDDLLSHDPASRVACEVMANTGLIAVFGEVTTKHYSNIPKIVRQTLDNIGYNHCGGFTADSCAVLVSLDEQSPDIAGGVNTSLEARAGSDDPLDLRGAGDQGMMFGFACTESEVLEPNTFMPLPIHLAHLLARRLAEVRKQGLVEGLEPDGKTQVTLAYEDWKPTQVQTLLISTQHQAETTREQIEAGLFEHVVKPLVPAKLAPGGSLEGIEFIVNPAGDFIKGGPEADSGLTGRKIIVDTYGGMSRHGGGAFSGKDPSKVDRAAAYYTRYVAKNLVAAGVAERIELQVSYAIGRAKPLGLMVECFGTENISEEKLMALLNSGELFDFRPQAIIEALSLLTTKYLPLAAYGHFGRADLDLPWERLDKVDAVKQALGT